MEFFWNSSKIPPPSDPLTKIDKILTGEAYELFVNFTANIFEVIFTVFNCVPISTVVSLYGLHLIAAPSTVE